MDQPARSLGGDFPGARGCNPSVPAVGRGRKTRWVLKGSSAPRGAKADLAGLGSNAVCFLLLFSFFNIFLHGLHSSWNAPSLQREQQWGTHSSFEASHCQHHMEPQGRSIAISATTVPKPKCHSYKPRALARNGRRQSPCLCPTCAPTPLTTWGSIPTEHLVSTGCTNGV